MGLEFDARLSTVVEVREGRHVGSEPVNEPLSLGLLSKMNRYWCAANYLTVGQIYLQENPLLRDSLSPDHVKKRLLGHWGTSPGINFIYVHLNRLIIEKNANIICIIGPGHGGPAGNANAWLEGSYTEIHHPITQDEAGMRLLFRRFSTPGGVSSHCGAHLPGSIHEGGELGYALLHAYGAAFDNPDLIVACVIGDGEAETGPLEGSWKGNKFLNPVRDGAVLPILHLNGYKISVTLSSPSPWLNQRVERPSPMHKSAEDRRGRLPAFEVTAASVSNLKMPCNSPSCFHAVSVSSLKVGGQSHESNSTAPQSWTEPMARQHNARPAGQRHARAVHQGILRDRTDIQSYDLRSRPQEQYCLRRSDMREDPGGKAGGRTVLRTGTRRSHPGRPHVSANLQPDQRRRRMGVSGSVAYAGS